VNCVFFFCTTVYVQYEVSQLFKKEYLDLCVLQSEKQDGVKYIVTMHSVQWPDCPTQDNITRVEVRDMFVFCILYILNDKNTQFMAKTDH